eukprot:tig00021238_g19542.t1
MAAPAVSGGVQLLSDILGWTYFAAWSISFWPQVILCYRTKSVVGLSLDFLALNLTGHTCYTIYTLLHYWLKPDGSVAIQDIFFGVHAVALTAVNCFQAVVYERGGARVARPVQAAVALVWSAGILGAALVAGRALGWMTFALILGNTKLCISFVKYAPQAWLNYKRKSTRGWSIHNILLDFTGGLLSMLQLVLLSQAAGGWGLVFSNPIKLLLSFESMGFDALFIVQHYLLYSKGDGYEEIKGDNAGGV